MNWRRYWTDRMRMLLLAGLAAPAVMGLAGWLLGYLVRGRGFHLALWPAPLSAAEGAGVALLSMGGVSLLYKIDERLERSLRESGTRVALEALQNAGYPVMLVVVVTSAFGEEMLFRGGLQPITGVLIAALLFGFSHGGWRREMVPYAVAASISGTMFGLLYRFTGDLWAPMSAHAVHNLLSLLMLGKRIDFRWEGWRPVLRLLPEEDFPEADLPDDGLAITDVAPPRLAPRTLLAPRLRLVPRLRFRMVRRTRPQSRRSQSVLRSRVRLRSRTPVRRRRR